MDALKNDKKQALKVNKHFGALGFCKREIAVKGGCSKIAWSWESPIVIDK